MLIYKACFHLIHCYDKQCITIWPFKHSKLSIIFLKINEDKKWLSLNTELMVEYSFLVVFHPWRRLPFS